MPTPRSDALTGPGALFDNTSATAATVPAGPLALPVASATKAAQYTLTSSKAAQAPDGWTLEGSADGTVWKTLDQRAGQTFAWDKQTRVFTVAHPGSYAHYRLVDDRSGRPGGGGVAALALSR